MPSGRGQQRCDFHRLSDSQCSTFSQAHPDSRAIRWALRRVRAALPSLAKRNTHLRAAWGPGRLDVYPRRRAYNLVRMRTVTVVTP